MNVQKKEIRNMSFGKKRLSTRDYTPSEAELNWIITIRGIGLKIRDEWITHSTKPTRISAGDRDGMKQQRILTEGV